MDPWICDGCGHEGGASDFEYEGVEWAAYECPECGSLEVHDAEDDDDA